MAGQIDLHMHTSYSDGVLEPSDLLARVREAKLRAFSITDHDTLDGYRCTLPLLHADDPELVPGVELSVDCEGEDLHLLGYLFDADSLELNRELERFQRERNLRGQRMVERLEQLGLTLSPEAVRDAAGQSAVGRPHVAEAMVRQGLVSNFEEAFRKYIGNHGPAYVPKAKLKPKEAINLVHRAGGVVVMAHPWINEMYRFLEELTALNLDGVEVYHYSHNRQQVKELKAMARRLKLLLSGGSDFHGRHEGESNIGDEPVPVEFLDKLKERAEKIRGWS
jgi:predicted metal-dependent phosphoesterase TrpH